MSIFGFFQDSAGTTVHSATVNVDSTEIRVSVEQPASGGREQYTRISGSRNRFGESTVIRPDGSERCRDESADSDQGFSPSQRDVAAQVAARHTGLRWFR